MFCPFHKILSVLQYVFRNYWGLSITAQLLYDFGEFTKGLKLLKKEKQQKNPNFRYVINRKMIETKPSIDAETAH